MLTMYALFSQTDCAFHYYPITNHLYKASSYIVVRYIIVNIPRGRTSLPLHPDTEGENIDFAARTCAGMISLFMHNCNLHIVVRYIIVKHVRKDHLDQLPVPSRIKNYLNTPFYYSEQVTSPMCSLK
jgi:hypothetical protein